MCFSTPKWKIERDRDIVTDHKFDFVDVNEFVQRNCLRRVKYSFVFLVVMKSVLVYIADLWTAGILLIFNEWNSAVKPKIPFDVSKWIFLGCIFVSFALLFWDARKARAIIKSRDISYAFTSIIAYRTYTLQSYAHYCFFSQINNSKKKWDDIAFFVFFAFKGWKRLVFAEAPRQAINAFTLYSILASKHFSPKYSAYGDNIVQKLAMTLMAFTLLIFIFSAGLLLIAFLLYLPLLCHIRGNLKEYCCHKIDKRIGELLRKKTRKRVQKRKLEAQAEAQGDFGHLKNKKGEMTENPLRQPTLPVFEEKQPTLPQFPPPGMYDDRMMTNSPEPMYVAGQRSAGGRTPPPYGQPPYGQPPFAPGAAGQRHPQHRDSDLSSTGYQYGPTTGYLNPAQPKRNYSNLAAMQMSANNTSGRDEDPYGGTVVEEYTSEYGDITPPSISETNSTTPALGHGYEPYDDSYPVEPYNANNFNNNSNSQFMPPASNRFDQYDYRAPSPRSESPTPSIGSTGSGNRGTIPSRYQQETRSPRYNNYGQQPGRRGGGDGY